MNNTKVFESHVSSDQFRPPRPENKRSYLDPTVLPKPLPETKTIKLEATTVYQTPEGEIEIPSEDIEMEIQLAKSAPQWMVTPLRIINTRKVKYFQKNSPNEVYVQFDSGYLTIETKNLDQTWSAIQKAFAEGI